MSFNQLGNSLFVLPDPLTDVILAQSSREVSVFYPLHGIPNVMFSAPDEKVAAEELGDISSLSPSFPFGAK